MKTIFFSLMMSLAMHTYAYSAILLGTVIDMETKSPIENAQVTITNASYDAQEFTDSDGNYEFRNLDAGTYFIYVKVDMKMDSFGRIEIFTDQIKICDIIFNKSFEITEIVIKDYKGLFDFAKPTEHYISGKEIKTIPVTQVKDIIPLITPSAYQRDAGAPVQIKGARAGDLVYYIDGIRYDDDPIVPMNAIRDIQIISGGLPARYGDGTAGVVIITTKSWKDVLNERN